MATRPIISRCITGLFALLALQVRASAQECIHPLLTLPGLSGAPVWFGTAGASDWRPELDDPRWAPAPRTLFANSSALGGVDDGQYRILVVGGTLYVSFQALIDDNTGSTDYTDAVYFGFTEGASGNGARVVAIAPDRTSPSVAGPGAGVPQDMTRPVDTSAGYVNWYSTVDITGGSPIWVSHPSEKPPWLRDVATWNGSPGAKWAVTFKIDLASLAISGALKLFFGMRINGSSGVLKLASSSYASSDAASINGETIVPTTAVDWVDYVSPGQPCLTGASLSPSQIGIAAGASITNQVQACLGPTCPKVNTFRVKVRNVPAIGITDFAVRARIRMADWGPTPNDPKAPWRPIAGISPSVLTDPQSSFPPFCSGASCVNEGWAWSFASGDAGMGEATLEYTCKVQAGDGYCPNLSTPGANPHQAMLVEVTSAPGSAPLSFQTAAAYVALEYQGLASDGGAEGGPDEGGADTGIDARPDGTVVADGPEDRLDDAMDSPPFTDERTSDVTEASDAPVGMPRPDGGVRDASAGIPDGSTPGAVPPDDGGCQCGLLRSRRASSLPYWLGVAWLLGRRRRKSMEPRATTAAT